jgi:hypothetical protein
MRGKRDAISREVAKGVANLAEAEWRRDCERVRRSGLEVGKVVMWANLCWTEGMPKEWPTELPSPEQTKASSDREASAPTSRPPSERTRSSQSLQTSTPIRSPEQPRQRPHDNAARSESYEASPRVSQSPVDVRSSSPLQGRPRHYSDIPTGTTANLTELSRSPLERLPRSNPTGYPFPSQQGSRSLAGDTETISTKHAPSPKSVQISDHQLQRVAKTSSSSPVEEGVVAEEEVDGGRLHRTRASKSSSEGVKERENGNGTRQVPRGSVAAEHDRGEESVPPSSVSPDPSPKEVLSFHPARTMSTETTASQRSFVEKMKLRYAEGRASSKAKSAGGNSVRLDSTQFAGLGCFAIDV